MQTAILITSLILLSSHSKVTVVGQQLPFGEIKSECPCTLNGFSGTVNTNRPRCRGNSRNGPYCYVANPTTCKTDSPSRRYRGASWIDCSQCLCSENGVSNRRSTGRRGCGLHDSAKEPFCYLSNPSACSSARRSRRFRPAYYTECSYEEALYFAAKTDNVEAISKLRDNGANMSVIIEVKMESGAYQLMSLADYAAAYGSFAVLEDLILGEEEFNCKIDQHPRENLCIFSKAAQCNQDSIERQAIERLLSLYESSCRPRALPSIIGTPTPCRRYPYFVSLRWSYENNYEHYCGGVLIEQKFVLTAAHCLDPIFGNPLKPILLVESDASQPGVSFCNTNTEFRKSKNVFIHEGWLRGPLARTLGNPDDIALIQMNWKSKKQPIAWEEEADYTEDDVMTGIGLGRTSQRTSFSAILQQYQVNLRNLDICNVGYDRTFQSGILCMGGSGPDFCEGDDGGPLISVKESPSEDHLVGIAHLKDGRIPCGTVGVPGLFIDLNNHKSWIKSKL